VIKAANWQEITRLAREAVTTVLGFELAHLGINSPDAASALGTAEKLAKLFGMAAKDGNSSVFAGTGFEMMKAPYLGAHGHVAIRTNSIPRAMAYLASIGVDIDMATAKPVADGSIGAVYLEEEIAGFAFHLLQKK
jgi:2-dehydro-3-deoxyphosphogluconate aldolase/(4S)-4-hydroxy-2-oxoglutarate aldolase